MRADESRNPSAFRVFGLLLPTTSAADSKGARGSRAGRSGGKNHGRAHEPRGGSGAPQPGAPDAETFRQQMGGVEATMVAIGALGEMKACAEIVDVSNQCGLPTASGQKKAIDAIECYEDIDEGPSTVQKGFFIGQLQGQLGQTRAAISTYDRFIKTARPPPAGPGGEAWSYKNGVPVNRHELWHRARFSVAREALAEASPLLVGKANARRGSLKKVVKRLERVRSEHPRLEGMATVDAETGKLTAPPTTAEEWAEAVAVGQQQPHNSSTSTQQPLHRRSLSDMSPGVLGLLRLPCMAAGVAGKRAPGFGGQAGAPRGADRVPREPAEAAAGLRFSRHSAAASAHLNRALPDKAVPLPARLVRADRPGHYPRAGGPAAVRPAGGLAIVGGAKLGQQRFGRWREGGRRWACRCACAPSLTGGRPSAATLLPTAQPRRLPISAARLTGQRIAAAAAAGSSGPNGCLPVPTTMARLARRAGVGAACGRVSHKALPYCCLPLSFYLRQGLSVRFNNNRGRGGRHR
eukprot:SAG22_NODE_454_length_10311_cov_4.304446_3_plen_521_part_00